MTSEKILEPEKKPEPEQPLPAAKHGYYLAMSTLLIAAFYVYYVVTLVFGAVAWVLAAVMAIVTSQYGLVSTAFPLVAGIGGVLAELLRGLKLERGVEYQVKLERAEAPRLWDEVEALAKRLDISPPQEILLLVNLNAWVKLKGFAAGRGHTQLGVGYDLLAGLSTAEARAVLAHEIAHAKYVRRGYQGFLIRGLMRLGKCANGLNRLANDKNRHKSARRVAELAFKIPDAIGTKTGRMMAACSRYDEFLADRVAAEICGAQTMRSALMATHVLDYQADKLEWRERLLQLDRQPGYTAWLQSKLQIPDDTKRLELEARTLDRSRRHELNTHPALPDRLVALEGGIEAPPVSDGVEAESAVFWFVRPDVTARRLLLELERIAAETERKATDALARHMKRSEWTRNAALHQIFGIFFCCGWGAAFTWGWWTCRLADANDDASMLGFIALFCYGIAGFIFAGTLKPRVNLPFPTFASYRAASYRRRERDKGQRAGGLELKAAPTEEKAALEARQDEAQALGNVEKAAELRAAGPAPNAKTRTRLRHWLNEARLHLEAANYENAFHCARFALECKQNHPDAVMVYSLGSAHSGNRNALNVLHESLMNRSHFNGQWAMAWCGCMVGEFTLGEAYLLELARRRASVPLFWALLGMCQARNGKPREALASRRKALELSLPSGDLADEICHRFVLSQNLTALGHVQEAGKELEWLDEHRDAITLENGLDPMAFEAERLRWLVSAERVEAAGELASRLIRELPEPAAQLELAEILEDCAAESLSNMAREMYLRLLEQGHYPQVCQSLSRMAFAKEQRDEAREWLLKALNATAERPPDATHPLNALDDVLTGLRVIEDAGPQRAQAFECELKIEDSPLRISQLTLLCVYPDEAAAREAALTVFRALLPERELDASVTVKLAEKEMQPDDEVPPGMYGSRWN